MPLWLIPDADSVLFLGSRVYTQQAPTRFLGAYMMASLISVRRRCSLTCSFLAGKRLTRVCGVTPSRTTAFTTRRHGVSKVRNYNSSSRHGEGRERQPEKLSSNNIQFSNPPNHLITACDQVRGRIKVAAASSRSPKNAKVRFADYSPAGSRVLLLEPLLFGLVVRSHGHWMVANG
jgi:hypothetical protein